MFTQNFLMDISLLNRAIEDQKSFAFARYADGEYAAIHNIPLTGGDGWTIQGTKLAEEINKTLDHKEDNYFYGMSCPCCDPPKYEYFKERFKEHKGRITYANLLVNGNTNVWNSYFKHLLKNSIDQYTLISSKAPRCNKARWAQISPIEVNNFDKRCDYLKEWLQTEAQNRNNGYIFLFSAGPLSEVFIHWMYEVNPNNVYIDIGTSLDYYLFGDSNRSHFCTSSYLHKKICSFK